MVTYIRILIYYTILLFLVSSCSDIFEDSSSDSTLINETSRINILNSAMEWYGERIIQSKASDNWIPIWEDAYIDSDGDYIVIEIPLSYIKEKIIIMIK